MRKIKLAGKFKVFMMKRGIELNLEATPGIYLDTKAGEYGYSISKDIMAGKVLKEEALHLYYESEGIQFLKEHLINYGGYQLSFEDFKDFHCNQHPMNVFVRSILEGINKVKNTEELPIIDFQGLEKEVLARVNTYLNEDISKEHINLFLIFGIRGTAITHGNNIALDLCDNGLYVNGKLSLSRVADLLGHEVHHIGVHKANRRVISSSMDKKERFKSIVEEGLLSEGMAYVYFTPWLKEEPDIKPIWEENMINIDKTIEELYLFLKRELSTSQQEEFKNMLFGDELLGYTMGYYMVNTIKEAVGDEAVLNLLDDFQLFEEWYKLKD